MSEACLYNFKLHLKWIANTYAPNSIKAALPYILGMRQAKNPHRIPFPNPISWWKDYRNITSLNDFTHLQTNSIP